MGKAFEKQIKPIDDQGKKQVVALNTLKSNNQLTIEDVIPNDALKNDEAKKELDKIKEMEENVGREKVIYEKNEYTYSFKIFETIKHLLEIFMRAKLLLKKLMNVKLIYLPKSLILKNTRNDEVKKKKQEKEIVLQNLYNFLRVEKEFLTLLKAKYF